MQDQKMVMPGYREGQLEAVLNRHIPVAAAFGGMCLGALTVCRYDGCDWFRDRSSSCCQRHISVF